MVGVKERSSPAYVWKLPACVAVDWLHWEENVCAGKFELVQEFVCEQQEELRGAVQEQGTR